MHGHAATLLIKLALSNILSVLVAYELVPPRCYNSISLQIPDNIPVFLRKAQSSVFDVDKYKLGRVSGSWAIVWEK